MFHIRQQSIHVNKCSPGPSGKSVGAVLEYDQVVQYLQVLDHTMSTTLVSVNASPRRSFQHLLFRKGGGIDLLCSPFPQGS